MGGFTIPFFSWKKENIFAYAGAGRGNVIQKHQTLFFLEVGSQQNKNPTFPIYIELEKQQSKK
jgi:hypothetical protein